MNARQKYRRFVCFLLVLSILALGCCGVEVIRDQIPDQMKISDQEEIPELFHPVFTDLVKSQKEGEYTLSYRLFG